MTESFTECPKCGYRKISIHAVIVERVMGGSSFPSAKEMSNVLGFTFKDNDGGEWRALFNTRQEIRQVVSASGARYSSADWSDGDTTSWLQLRDDDGNRLQFVWSEEDGLQVKLYGEQPGSVQKKKFHQLNFEPVTRMQVERWRAEHRAEVSLYYNGVVTGAQSTIQDCNDLAEKENALKFWDQ